MRARDRLVRSLAPEDTLRRGIESYIKWSERDGNIARTSESHIPVLAVGTAKPGESVASVVGRVTDQLHSLGRRYREKWLLRQSIEGSEAETLRSSHYGKVDVVTKSEEEELDDEEEEEAEEQDPDLISTNNDRNNDDETPPEDAIGEEYSHDLPTLYGIVIKHTVVAMVTYDVCVPGQEVRFISIFDFSKPDQDVWNGLAVAILVVICRNYLMDLAKEEEAERQSGTGAEEGEEEDGDA